MNFSSLKNTPETYGLVARVLHWVIALNVIGLFILGKWMHNLDYTDPLYHVLPGLHISFGILLIAAMTFRIAWTITNPQPKPLSHWKLEAIAGKVAHYLLYALLLGIMISGYLDGTSGGEWVEFFGLFSLPPIFDVPAGRNFAGFWHDRLAHVLMGLVILHILAALKHHFFDKDATLTRMWSGKTSRKD